MSNTYTNHYLLNLIDGVYTTDQPVGKLITQSVCPTVEYTNEGISHRAIGGPIKYDPQRRMFIFEILGFYLDGSTWKASPDDNEVAVASTKSFVDATTGVPVTNEVAIKLLDENGDEITEDGIPPTSIELHDGYCTDFDFVAKIFGVEGTALNDYLYQVIATKKGVTIP